MSSVYTKVDDETIGEAITPEPIFNQIKVSDLSDKVQAINDQITVLGQEYASNIALLQQELSDIQTKFDQSGVAVPDAIATVIAANNIKPSPPIKVIQ